MPRQEINRVWDAIIEYGIATATEMTLVTQISGESIETLNTVIYARTGYDDLDQYLEYEV